MADVTVNVAASADDVQIRSDPTASYPPTGTTVDNTSLWTIKQLDTPNYRVSCGLLRFDTSVIPDGATITSAALRITPTTGAINTDARNMNFEWYPWTAPAVGGDYTALAGTTANVTLASSFVGGSPNDLTLTDPSTNINKTGYTGIRFGYSGGAPTGINEQYFYDLTDGGNREARLIVSYTEEETQSYYATRRRTARR